MKTDGWRSLPAPAPATQRPKHDPKGEIHDPNHHQRSKKLLIVDQERDRPEGRDSAEDPGMPHEAAAGFPKLRPRKPTPEAMAIPQIAQPISRTIQRAANATTLAPPQTTHARQSKWRRRAARAPPNGNNRRKTISHLPVLTIDCFFSCEKKHFANKKHRVSDKLHRRREKFEWVVDGERRLDPLLCRTRNFIQALLMSAR